MNRSSALRLILPLFACSVCGLAEPPPVPAERKPDVARLLAEREPVRIACFGDSITGVYYHTGGRRSWCEVLGIALERLYPGARIKMINAGISGNTTADALKRMETDVLSHEPQLVVAMFGMNDVGKGVGPVAFRANLGEIVTRARARGAEVILMTPNAISPGDPLRPPARVAEYAEIVRQAGRELGVQVVDCFRVYEAIRAADPWAWTRMMSDSIHPNMRGHKIFAAEAAFAVSGRRPALEDLPPLEPGLPRVLSRLRDGQPVDVVAMKPYDSLIGPALASLFPGARVRVTSWDPGRKSLAAIEDEAKGRGWPRFRDRPDLSRPDLVVLAVPAGAGAPNEEQFYHSYTWIINWSLSVGAPAWDCLAILPSVAEPEPGPGQRRAETLALDVILGHDMPWLQRAPGDDRSASELLARRLESLLDLSKP